MQHKSLICDSNKRKRADLLVLPVWEDKKGPKIAVKTGEFDALVKPLFSSKDFSGKEGEKCRLYRSSGKEPCVLLIGLGKEKECSFEAVRASYASAMRAVVESKAESVNVLFPLVPHLEKSALQKALMEGVLMAAYTFDALKGKPEKRALKVVHFCADVPFSLLKHAQSVISSVNLVRDLVNGNADEVNVDRLARLSKEIAKEYPSIKVHILGKKELEKEKMGLLLAVGKGAIIEPALILLEYNADLSSKEKIALVGKGITFDSGGLNLKGSGSAIETMKSDMAGAAAVLGTLRAAAALKLKVNLVGALAVAENAIGPASYKPGDVYKSHLGKTVEITNTDAEGRLVLADTLSYVEERYHPKHLIDLATLTGGVVIALGEEASGLFSNDEALAKALEEAGGRTHERVWRLPLYSEYKEELKSTLADMKNSGSRKASSPVAATFLKAFVTSSSWAHLDIAGTAYLSAPKSYHPTLATGVGVRLLVDFLEHLHAQGS